MVTDLHRQSSSTGFSANKEEFDETRHPKRSVVKGVTYHKLEFDDEEGTVTVLFDV